jgi:outer membrane protein OmpA-like peptidoglycan-associated protein
MKVIKPLIVASLVLSVAACADDPYRRAKIGAGVGAVVGAVVGHQVNHKHGKVVGGVLGAMTGAAVGGYMDKQQRELEDKLAREREANALEIERMRDNSLKINIDNEVSFDFDSATVKPGFKGTLDKVASVLGEYDKTIVHVVGHTDSKGGDDYNVSLSRRRAGAVADYLASQGIHSQRLLVDGRGESEPRASNDTEEGRAMNRRVEIFIKPVVEGQEDSAYER